MPIGLGLGSSHPTYVILKKPEEWIDAYQRVALHTPQPPEAALETPEVIQSYIDRIDRSFQVLRQQLLDYDPDLLVVIGGDQSEIFDRSNVPNLMIYLGEEATGHNVPRFQEPSAETFVRLKVDVETSRWLLHQLVAEGFDVAFSTEIRPPAGRNPARSLSHAIVRPACFLIPRPDLPTVLIWENTYDPPSLPAARCYELGRTLARVLKNDPRRIAILGSGDFPMTRADPAPAGSTRRWTAGSWTSWPAATARPRRTCTDSTP